MKKINYLFILGALLNIISVNAQDTTSIPSESVQVIKNYEAIISQAKKKEVPIKREEQTFSNIKYSYKLDNITSVDFERPEPKINVLGYQDKIKRKEDIKDGTVYGAYGNFSTIKAGGAYHYYIEDWIDLGFKIDHYSAKNKDLAYNKSSQTNANVYVSYFLSEKNKIGLDFYGSRQRHYTDRSFLTETPTTDSTLYVHPADMIGAKLNYAHTSFEKTGLAFRFRLSYDRLKDNNGDYNENLLSSEVNIIKKINDDTNFEMPLVYNNYKPSIDFQDNLNDYSIRPTLNYKGLNFKLKAGLEYTKADTSSFIFPIIDATYPAAFAGIDLRFFTSSSFNRNSFHYVSEYFPYFISGQFNFTPNYLRSYNLNLIKPINNLAFGFNIALNSYTNELLVSTLGQDDAAYLTRNIDRKEIRITPSVQFKTETVNAELNFNYNVFLNEDSLNILTYRPRFFVDLSASQNLFDNKLRLRQKLRYNSARKVLAETELSLDAFVDIALGIDYRINKSFSAFVDVTNLLGSEYTYWYNNPVYQQQVWVGIKLRI
mgnify:CR=1 FL=1